MKSQEKKGRVFVGLSGGVDSAVSAALLKKDGYEVTGVFIKTWTPEWLETECTWKEDRRSAMKAAAVLDIPFITLDLEKEYKEGVADYMIREYKEGRTPNPDVACNKEIKFGGFLKFALQNGADYIATGHYSQNKKGELREGKDKNKDQSYFLWTLNQKQLKHVLFPIGHLEKSEVRKLAAKFKLPQATRKDSQGICFLGDIDMKEFLSHYIEEKEGEVLDENGKVIGTHKGALFFTLGERHGFNITNKSPDSDKLYVVAKDIKTNTITVAPKAVQKSVSKKVWPRATEENRGLLEKYFSVRLEGINWISGHAPNKNKILCRYRYRQTKVPCIVVGNRVEFITPQEAISPGQSIVFYDDDKCLGGCIIS